MSDQKVSAEERNKRVSTLLHQVDEAVKQSKFDLALEKLRKVYEYDLKNMFARAYEERILVMMVEQERRQAKVEAAQNIEEQVTAEVRRRLNDFYRTQEIETQKRKVMQKEEHALEEQARRASVREWKEKDSEALEQERLKRFEELETRMIAQTRQMLQESSSRQLADMMSVLERTTASGGSKSIDRNVLEQLKNEYEAGLADARTKMEEAMAHKLEDERRSIREEAFQILQEDHRRAQEELIRRMEEERQQMVTRDQQKAHNNSLEAYRSLMMLTSQLELAYEVTQPLLRSLRVTLSIGEEEHQKVEREVQVNTYIAAVRETWKSGKPAPDELEVLQSLQRLYTISDAEHKTITDQVKLELGLPDEIVPIFVIDDDQHILAFIKHVLKKTYQTIHTSSSIEEALPSLQKTPPALILCDVNLGPGKMGGFTFYEKLIGGEYGDALKKVPFILMSALTEDFFIKSAKELGVKSYLAKPFTRESLESSVKAVLV